MPWLDCFNGRSTLVRAFVELIVGIIVTVLRWNPMMITPMRSASCHSLVDPFCGEMVTQSCVDISLPTRAEMVVNELLVQV